MQTRSDAPFVVLQQWWADHPVLVAVRRFCASPSVPRGKEDERAQSLQHVAVLGEN